MIILQRISSKLPRNMMTNTFWIKLLFVTFLTFQSLRVLTEQDVFWQVRSGQELLKTWSFPDGDTWSLVSKGGTWLNVQWLSTVIMALVHSWYGFAGLVWLRAVLVFTTLVPFCLYKNVRLDIFSILIALVFTTIHFRMQMRSETFVIAVLSVFSYFATQIKSGEIKRSKTYYLSAATLVILLSAQLHIGAAIFAFALVLAFTLEIFDVKDIKTFGVYGILFAVPLFLTPNHLKVMGHLWSHFFYFDENWMQNPDHQPLQLIHMKFLKFGMGGLGFFVFTCMLLVKGYFKEISKSTIGALIILLTVFFLMSLGRIRSIPYFALVAAHLWFSSFLLKPKKWANLGMDSIMVMAVFLPIFVFWKAERTPFGFDFREPTFPIRASEKIGSLNLPDPIYSTYAIGHYLLFRFPDRPVFVDTRETMYRDLQIKIVDAYLSPKRTHDLLEKYHFQTVLLPIPRVGEDDLSEAYFPKSEWAILGFDRYAEVFSKRANLTHDFLHDHEYRWLRPGVSVKYWLKDLENPESVKQAEREIERCFTDTPDLPICKLSELVLMFYQRNPNWILKGMKYFAENPVDIQSDAALIAIADNIDRRLMRY